MKNDKRRYNRINKKRIFILICSIMLVIFEIVAFRNSRAEKVIDITASIIDDGGVVPTEQISLEAKSSDSSGYYFVLPEYINNKKIDSYIVTEQVIHEKEDSSKTSIVENVTEESKSEQQNVEVNNVLTNEISEQENEKNVNISVETQNVEVQNVTAQSTEQISNTMISTNTIENTISSESTNSVMEKNEQDIKEEQQEEEKSLTTLKSPGDTLYLTDKEASSKQIELKVNYSTIQKNEDTLYDQTLQAEVDNEGDGIADCLIKIEGFMPLNASVNVKIITMDEIEKPIGTMLSDKVSFKKAYDIKILSDDKEYEPTDFDTNVKVTITGVDAINENKQKYKVVHIENEEKATEVTGVKTTNDEISFPAESFSVYAVLLEDGVQATSLYTNNMDGASVWDGSSASGFRFGEGTKEYPYLISNAEELSYFANRVNSGTSYDGVYFELIADINLNKMEWTPIGDYSNPFKGIFNGAGHTVAMCFNRMHAVPVKYDDFSRTDVADECGSHRIQRTAFGGNDISAVFRFSVAERPESVFVSDGNQFGRGHDYQRVRAAQPIHGAFHGNLNGGRIQSFLRNDVRNDFRVTGGVENRTFQFQLVTKLVGIDQVSVVCQCNSSLDMIDHNGLCVVAVIGTGGAVADMPDGNLTASETVENIRSKNVVDKTDVLVGGKGALVIDDNAAGFLPAVLKCEQSVIGGACKVGSFRGINSEYTAFFSQITHGTPGLNRTRASSFHGRHLPRRPYRDGTGLCPAFRW